MIQSPEKDELELAILISSQNMWTHTRENNTSYVALFQGPLPGEKAFLKQQSFKHSVNFAPECNREHSWPVGSSGDILQFKKILLEYRRKLLQLWELIVKEINKYSPCAPQLVQTCIFIKLIALHLCVLLTRSQDMKEESSVDGKRQLRVKKPLDGSFKASSGCFSSPTNRVSARVV